MHEMVVAFIVGLALGFVVCFLCTATEIYELGAIAVTEGRVTAEYHPGTDEWIVYEVEESPDVCESCGHRSGR